MNSTKETVVVQVQNSPSKGLAAVMSVFIAGLGQLYRGKALAGFIWFLVTYAGYAFFLIPGIILHLFCIIDAGSESKPSATSE